MEKQNTKKVIRTGLDMEISGNLCVNKKINGFCRVIRKTVFLCDGGNPGP